MCLLKAASCINIPKYYLTQNFIHFPPPTEDYLITNTSFSCPNNDFKCATNYQTPCTQLRGCQHLLTCYMNLENPNPHNICWSLVKNKFFADVSARAMNLFFCQCPVNAQSMPSQCPLNIILGLLVKRMKCTLYLIILLSLSGTNVAIQEDIANGKYTQLECCDSMIVILLKRNM